MDEGEARQLVVVELAAHRDALLQQRLGLDGVALPPGEAARHRQGPGDIGPAPQRGAVPEQQAQPAPPLAEVALDQPVVAERPSEPQAQAAVGLQAPGQGGAQVVELEVGDLLAWRDPAVALPVDRDEDMALLEVGAVQLARRMGPGAELEHHRREVQPLDRLSGGLSLLRQLLQRRADEDPQALVRGADDAVRWRGAGHWRFLAPPAPRLRLPGHAAARRARERHRSGAQLAAASRGRAYANSALASS